MSGQALSWAKDQRAPDSTSKAVLMALADYANQKGEAWPAVRELAGELQLSERTVQRALGKLVTAGLLSRAAQFRSNGSQSTDRYTFPLPKKGASEGGTPVTDCHPPGDTHVTPGVTPMSPLEPPLEPEGTDVPSTRARDADAGPQVEAEPTAPFRTGFGAWLDAGGRAASFEPQCWAAWCDVAEAAGGEAALLGCVQAFLADPTLKRRSYGLGGMQNWLRKGGWRSYVGVVAEAGEASAAVPGGRFVGPEEVRAVVSAHLGEPGARSYIDPAAWQGEGRLLTPRNGIAWQRIKDLDWASVGVTVINPRAGR
jgi:hypothetical protein